MFKSVKSKFGLININERIVCECEKFSSLGETWKVNLAYCVKIDEVIPDLISSTYQTPGIAMMF